MNTDIITALNDERRRVWARIRALADLTMHEVRGLTPEEQGTWDGLHERLGRLDEWIRDEKGRQA